MHTTYARPGGTPSHGRRGSHLPLWKRWTPSLAGLLVLISLLALAPIVLLMVRLGGPGSNPRTVSLTTCQKILSPPLVCAHGGDTSAAPPNTHAAYMLALEAKVDCMEIDASRTADGMLVAIHDRDLQLITGRKYVTTGDLTLEEIRQLDAGARHPRSFHGEKVLLLEDALRLVSKHLVQIVVDVKIGPPRGEEGLAQDVVDVMNRAGCTNCLVWAKYDTLPLAVQALEPLRKVGYILNNETHPNRREESFVRHAGMQVVGAHWAVVDETLVKLAQRHSKEIYTWTVNEGGIMRNLLDIGVAAIVTNHPRKLKGEIHAARNACKEAGYVV
ncbi:hypothetical protein KFL_000040410 [Klebsormidium nitens]|uniref:glycerophosphodiester phosphodiesterase n=1 Tax=Klebsormidium nitens TaxID=105231 RepID=A0A1Y1HLJ3_KLENI|nr:hypothetical protein KFL_000040410 [Klebsormidium nitens]|eukprot:GAQ77841.1 hypothetical protein KFL_000040410 [Klebsormidium nitens]